MGISEVVLFSRLTIRRPPPEVAPPRVFSAGESFFHSAQEEGRSPGFAFFGFAFYGAAFRIPVFISKRELLASSQSWYCITQLLGNSLIFTYLFSFSYEGKAYNAFPLAYRN